MTPGPPREELGRLLAELKEFVRYQHRLGLQAVPAPPMAPRRARVRAAAPPEVPAPPVAPEPALRPVQAKSLEEVRRELGDCRRCKLCTSRTQIVFGTGNPHAWLMFIGEGPGAEEDRQGEPFVGAAGQLLNRMLEKLGLSRPEVYIANVVKCRPPGNRNPEADETAACRPFLVQQIEAIRPEIIVTLGAIATHALLGVKLPISRLRGNWQQWRDIPVMPTFHPSYLLRVPQERKKTWDDMHKVLAAHRPPGGQPEAPTTIGGL